MKSKSWLSFVGLLAVAGLLTGIAILPSTAQPIAPKAQMTWEYKVTQETIPDEKALNELGKEGWELVTATTNSSNFAPGTTFVFKRAK